MSAAPTRPLPFPDRDSEPFWQALREGRLELQRCDDCQRYRFPPRVVCNRCHGFDASWVPVSGRGEVVSWVRTHQVFAPAYADEVPYLVVQVALAEQDDLLMYGPLTGDTEPSYRMPVQAVLVPATDEVTLVHWAPLKDRSAAGPGTGR